MHPERPFNFSQKVYPLPRGDVPFSTYVDGWLNLAVHDGAHAAAKRPWFG